MKTNPLKPFCEELELVPYKSGVSIEGFLLVKQQVQLWTRFLDEISTKVPDVEISWTTSKEVFKDCNINTVKLDIALKDSEDTAEISLRFANTPTDITRFRCIVKRITNGRETTYGYDYSDIKEAYAHFLIAVSVIIVKTLKQEEKIIDQIFPERNEIMLKCISISDQK